MVCLAKQYDFRSLEHSQAQNRYIALNLAPSSLSISYATENPVRFSSEYFDPETNLVYYNYRYYSPELGRWLSRDPIGEEGGKNLYAILFNNVVNWWDYLGLESLGTSILRIFLSRLVTWGVINWLRSDHYDLFDNEGEMNYLLSTDISDFYRNIVCANKSKSIKNKWKPIFIEQQRIGGTHYITGGLLGFWLSGSTEIFAHGSLEATCKGNKVYAYKNVYVNWELRDDIDANSFPGVAWLKGEQKNVFENDGNIIWSIIEGYWDLTADTFGDTDFSVSIYWRNSINKEINTYCD